MRASLKVTGLNYIPVDLCWGMLFKFIKTLGWHRPHILAEYSSIAGDRKSVNTSSGHEVSGRLAGPGPQWADAPCDIYIEHVISRHPIQCSYE